jgi:hypothetical protein
MWKKHSRAGRATDHNTALVCCKLFHSGHKTLSQYVIIIVFIPQKWLHKSASLLRYTYLACLVLQSELSQAVTPQTYFEGSRFESLPRHRIFLSWLRSLLLFLWSSVQRHTSSRWIISIFYGGLTVNFLDISLGMYHRKLSRHFVWHLTVNFLDYSLLTYSVFSWHFVGRLTFNFLGILCGVSRDFSRYFVGRFTVNLPIC